MPESFSWVWYLRVIIVAFLDSAETSSVDSLSQRLKWNPSTIALWAKNILGVPYMITFIELCAFIFILIILFWILRSWSIGKIKRIFFFSAACLIKRKHVWLLDTNEDSYVHKCKCIKILLLFLCGHILSAGEREISTHTYTKRCHSICIMFLFVWYTHFLRNRLWKITSLKSCICYIMWVTFGFFQVIICFVPSFLQRSVHFF